MSVPQWEVFVQTQFDAKAGKISFINPHSASSFGRVLFNSHGMRHMSIFNPSELLSMAPGDRRYFGDHDRCLLTVVRKEKNATPG